MGFEKECDLVSDIGGGYVMDDYKNVFSGLTRRQAEKEKEKMKKVWLHVSLVLVIVYVFASVMVLLLQRPLKVLWGVSPEIASSSLFPPPSDCWPFGYGGAGPAVLFPLIESGRQSKGSD